MAADAPPGPSLPRPAPPGFTSHAFITQTGTELAVRIWPADPPVDKPAPFISYTHGGGWFAGNHYAPLAWLDPGFRKRGYHLVSHNYRLGPQASIDTQLTDCLDAIAWLRATLPTILGADKVDVDRYLICGESAGGQLVALMAHHLSPPPRAVINAYGAVDPAAAWPILDLDPGHTDDSTWEGEFSHAELDAFLEDRDPANVLTDALWGDENLRFPEHVVAERWAVDFKYTRRIRLQSDLHRWRGDGSARLATTIRSLVTGTLHGERFADDKALREFLFLNSPSLLLSTKTWYPPTAFLHGMADEQVPLAQSQVMARKLREMGVPLVECYEPDMGHVFDNKYTGPDVPGWDTYIQPILDFCDHHIAQDAGGQDPSLATARIGNAR